MINITLPLTEEKIKDIKMGDIVLLNGTIYTARDAAHKKMLEHYQKTGEMLLKGEVIYYAGPCPKKPGEAIGSIGPTTSYRMDSYSLIFVPIGLLYSIGKGERSEAVKEVLRTHGGLHFDAIGGAGAYYKNCVKSAEVLLFNELGAEAIYKLDVENFPVIVNII